MAKNKTNSNNTSDANVDRRIVACEMTKIFTLGATSRRENPGQWGKERRTAYNDRVQMIQYLFDNGAYVQAKQWLEWLDSDHRITGKKVEQPSSQKPPKRT